MHARQGVVHIVDDDRETRRTLHETLLRVGLRVRSYSTGEQVLAEDELEPGCVLLELQLPGIDGRAVHREILRRDEPVRVIIITGCASIALAVNSMKDGALDVLQKPIKSEELIPKVKQLLELLWADLDRRDAVRHAEQMLERLTARQREVLDLLMEGLISKQIAARLGCSIRTVEAHRLQIMKRTEAASLTELIRMYMYAAEQPRAGAFAPDLDALLLREHHLHETATRPPLR